MCLEGIPRQHTAPRKWLGWEAKGWKRRKQRERPGLREQESMRNRKRGMRPLGETGKLETQREGDVQRGTNSGPRRCQEVEKNQSHHWTERRKQERGAAESRREGRQERECSGERALKERNQRAGAFPDL